MTGGRVRAVWGGSAAAGRAAGGASTAGSWSGPCPPGPDRRRRRRNCEGGRLGHASVPSGQTGRKVQKPRVESALAAGEEGDAGLEGKGEWEGLFYTT